MFMINSSQKIFLYNSRSHVNLEQDEVRRQDVLNSFQAKIQSDIDVLRNLTYRALEQQSQSRLSSFIFLLLFILVVVQVNQILSTFWKVSIKKVQILNE